jgi:hypothetical protein
MFLGGVAAWSPTMLYTSNVCRRGNRMTLADDCLGIDLLIRNVRHGGELRVPARIV